MKRWEEKKAFHESTQDWLYYKFSEASEALEFASFKLGRKEWVYDDGNGITLGVYDDGSVLLGLMKDYE